ncbi:MAG: maleylpyruvate isomerase N-terminal domain-containing protein [Bacteroidetes bacterium]|nr:maleylpyruvate isomerase N-terminal domain-containing protein [Bacteroidota bacterium]
MDTNREIPIDVVDLLPELDKRLIELLRSLQPEEWQLQTVAKLWKVKDVVAHLLDGNIRILSILRDNYSGETAAIKSYQDLVDFLNRLNADWVAAMKRVSPEMLIFLHEITGPLYCSYYKSLDPFGISKFAVNWAGENESKNWMHIAREYTEKWLHQQQIRDAVNKPGLMVKEFYYPFISIFMLALPYTFRDVPAANETTIKITINGNAGGHWFLSRSGDSWKLTEEKNKCISEVIIDSDTAWKLFSKSIRPEEIKNRITINGNRQLGEKVLTMVSVMA